MAEKLGPIDHVQRLALPWRTHVLTECGLPVEGHPVISREVFIERVKEFGQSRTMMMTCMTCYETTRRHPTFEQDPARALQREIPGWYAGKPCLLSRELRAIAILVDRHRDEFDELMQDQEEIVSIETAKRRAKPPGGQKW